MPIQHRLLHLPQKKTGRSRLMDCNVPNSPIETLDLAARQRQQQQAKKLTDQLNYWQQQLKTAPLILDLPMDHSRPSALNPVTVQHPFVLPKSLSAALKTLSHQEGVSFFTTLLTAWQLLLHRYSGQDDLLVGTPRMQYTSTGNEW